MATALEEHAEASAEKKGLTGEERRRYIGGIFEKVRKAHAAASPERKKQIEAKLQEINRQMDTARKKREEEEARRRASPLAGYWYDPGTPERTKLLKDMQEEARRERARQALLEHPIAERTEEKKAREAYSRLLAKYHNPKLQEERAAGRKEYDQLAQDLRKARVNRYGRGKSLEEQQIEKRRKELDAKYGFTEEEEQQRLIAQEEADRERRQQEEARRKVEEERLAQQERERAAHMARREQALKERDSWRDLSEADAVRKEKQIAAEYQKINQQREALRKAGKTNTPEYAKVEARHDLAQMRYQFIDSVVADKQRPARQAEQERAYRQEYGNWLAKGKVGKPPREGYLVSFDQARKIRGEALSAYHAAQKAAAKAGTPKPIIPPGDTKARLQDDYNRFYAGLRNADERKFADFYVGEATGRAVTDTGNTQKIPAARRKALQEQATALGTRSKAFLDADAAQAARTHIPASPSGDTRAKVQADYNKLWQEMNDRERHVANFYIQKALGQQPPERFLTDPSIPAKRHAEIEQKATALGERSKALLAS